MMEELRLLLEGDDELSKVVAREVFDMLPVRPNEIAEVGDARCHPAYRLGALTLCLSADTVSCQGFGQGSHRVLLIPVL